MARQIAEDHQARLRGDPAARAPGALSLRQASRAAVDTTQRARRATGWALVEIGFKLAVPAPRDSVLER
jgi:hypothetical protein